MICCSPSQVNFLPVTVAPVHRTEMCCAVGGTCAEDQLQARLNVGQREAGRDEMTCLRAPASQVSQWPSIPVTRTDVLGSKHSRVAIVVSST